MDRGIGKGYGLTSRGVRGLFTLHLGAVAEWLGGGLQSLLRRFDSSRHLRL
jgi:hypothetical protein